MKLVAISRVKNERDIIEAFVRHHAALFDQVIVLDDGSTDGTYDILTKLRGEGLPLTLISDPSVGYEQARYMTRLLRMAVNQHGADWVMPLDADEFIEPEAGQTLAQVLEGQAAQILSLAWHGFAWSPQKDNAEPNPVVRLRDRMPPSPGILSKVLVPAMHVSEGVSLGQGNHALLFKEEPLTARPFDRARLCHFPIRSYEQYAAKIAVGYLQYAATPGWDPTIGFHYLAPYRALSESVDRFVEMARVDSRRYSFYPEWPDPADPVDEPLDYRGGPLAFTPAAISPMTNVLHCAEAVAGKLVENAAKIDAAQRALLQAKGIASDDAARIIAQEADARTVIRARPNAGTTHTFQSFWGGGPLSPYEFVCLKSFIDCGHAFDLYTFDMSLSVPAGVRVCDAGEFFSRDDFFVYSDGFGKGSPSAFANLFRCKIMIEKGGWWVDTDVICLSRDIPAFSEFFAWEDARLINNAVLYFEPHHPWNLACLAEAQRRGRGVRWGDTGPNLTTKVAKHLGVAHRAYASSVCYPIHYSEAIDVLRPDRAENLRQRTEKSLFVHLWNAMFDHRGVNKAMLPPQGSILREWVDRHPVEGWRGEYSWQTLEQSLRPDTEPRMRLSADLAVGIDDLARSGAFLHEANASFREQNAALQRKLDGAILRGQHLMAERDAYAELSEQRLAELEMLRNSAGLRLLAKLRRAAGALRSGRRAEVPKT